MQRRKFIGGMTTAVAVLFAGCSNESDSETSTTESPTSTGGKPTGRTTGSATDEANATTSETTTDTTTEGTETTADGTTDGETTTETTETSETTTEGGDTTTATDVQTAGYKQFVDVSGGLRMAVTDAKVTDSYDSGGSTTTPSEGNRFLSVTFTTENTAQRAQSLPNGTATSVRTSSDTYGLISASESAWKGYVSSAVKAGATAEETVVFEVPKEAVSSFGISAQVFYVESGTKHVVRWSME